MSKGFSAYLEVDNTTCEGSKKRQLHMEAIALAASICAAVCISKANETQFSQTGASGVHA
jgi:hypothetical protein